MHVTLETIQAEMAEDLRAANQPPRTPVHGPYTQEPGARDDEEEAAVARLICTAGLQTSNAARGLGAHTGRSGC
jgi:hypothetical protein